MANGDFKPETITDALSEFSAGFNAGIAPVLLQKNQLGLAINATVRGAFIGPRPTRRRITLDFGGDGALETAVTNGLWQGSCYYKPDFGPESLIAAISGRLYQFIPSTTTAQVLDISPSPANPANIAQAWLWQAEKWIIWMDGQSIPVFWDGATARRSNGNSIVVGTTSADFNIPVIGGTVQLTLSGPYLGTSPEVVLIDGAQYEVSVDSASSGYGLVLENINAPTGQAYAVGTQILTDGKFVAFVGTPGGVSQVPGTSCSPGNITACTFFLELDREVPGLIGKTITFTCPDADAGHQGPFNFQVVGVVPPQPGQANQSWSYKVKPLDNGFNNLHGLTDPLTGTPVDYLAGGNPNTLVGTLTSIFIAPAPGQQANALINMPYTGPLDQVVTMNGQFFKIKSVIAPTSSTTINAKNLTANPGPDPTGSPITVTFPKDLLTIPELPPGRMGTYGRGRNWVCLIDGRSFIAGDIVGGNAGTAALDTRDSVLKVSENTFINQGGTFRVPGSGQEIRFMRFVTELDRSLGQGPLMVGTPNTIFSCDAPVIRILWQAITNPILTEALKGAGGLGQDSSINANGDLFFRSLLGIGSLILGRRDFATWGNVPISREIQPIIEQDDTTLLAFSRAIIFDNRMMMTLHPTSTANGVVHKSVAVINFDPISSLRGKAPSVYDSIWPDMNALHLVVGEFNLVERAFAFTFEDSLELHEILPSSSPIIYDNGEDPIVYIFESAPILREEPGQKRKYKRLSNGEISIDNLIGTAEFQVFYRPDSFPCWVPWTKFKECADPTGKIQFRPNIGLGEPDGKLCDPITNRPLCEGYYFQIKIIIKGHVIFKGGEFQANTVPRRTFAPMPCGALCEFTELEQATNLETTREIVFPEL